MEGLEQFFWFHPFGKERYLALQLDSRALQVPKSDQQRFHFVITKWQVLFKILIQHPDYTISDGSQGTDMLCIAYDLFKGDDKFSCAKCPVRLANPMNILCKETYWHQASDALYYPNRLPLRERFKYVRDHFAWLLEFGMGQGWISQSEVEVLMDETKWKEEYERSQLS